MLPFSYASSGRALDIFDPVPRLQGKSGFSKIRLSLPPGPGIAVLRPAPSNRNSIMQRDENSFYPRRDPAAGLEEDQENFLRHGRISLGLPSLFYASLREPRLFEIVVGRTMDAARCEPVTLEGFRLGSIDAATGFPGIFPSDASGTPELECLVVHDLTLYEQTMVAWYEWDEYDLRRTPLADGGWAQVFLPDLEAMRREHGPVKIEPWSFERWRSSRLDEAVDRAREWMAQRPADAALIEAGCFPPEDVPAAGNAAV